MIEMLGVLAIIGVLSVGGIAGYSKAMEMYKLNRYSQSMNELLWNFMQIKDNLDYTRGENALTHYPKILNEMGMIPDGISYVSPTAMRDSFNHLIKFFHDGRPNENHFNFMIFYTNSKESSMACKALVDAARHWHQEIWMLYRQPGKTSIPYYITYGDKYCTGRLRCLKDLTMSDIEELCYFYQNKDPNEYQYDIQVVFKAE